MYGKLFSSMYDGTLASKGPWQALVTFQQLIVLADQHGVVDMTPEAISRRTTIPLDIIQAGITALESPDPDSRTPDEEGRRLLRISDSRPWGWRIVNHGHYRAIRSQDERREYMRQYQRDRRAKGAVNQDVNSVSNVNPCSKQEAESKKQRESVRTTRVTTIPDDYWPTKDEIAFWKEHGLTQYEIEETTYKFVQHYQANGEKRASWNAAWKKWMVGEIQQRRRSAK